MTDQTGHPTYEGPMSIARIHVSHENGTTTSYPIAERTSGGWQSGVHFYPDKTVTKVIPLRVSAEEAPEGTEGAERPTGAQDDEIPDDDEKKTRAQLITERDDLAERLSEVLCDLTNGRLSKTGYDVRTMIAEIEATFEMRTPADFGWTVLAEGQVAVTRADLEWMRPREMSYADMDDFFTARNRLLAALDAGSES